MVSARSQAEVIGHVEGTVTLSVQANGGSVAVEVLHDSATDSWVLADTIAVDGAWPLRVGHAIVCIVPSGGGDMGDPVTQAARASDGGTGA